MDILHNVCDRSIVENESEYIIYLATLHNKMIKDLHNKHTINIINLDEVIKILNDYMSTHSKNFDFYFE